MSSNTWWSGPLVLIALRLLYAEARLARAEARGQMLVFRPILSLRLIAGVGILSLIIAFTMSSGTEETWVYGLAVGLLVLFCFGLPATVTIDSCEVRQEAWWGRRTIIGWSDVCGLEKRLGGEFCVFGRDGNTVSFSRYHVDPGRFEREIVQRAGLPGSIDATAPPTLRV